MAASLLFNVVRTDSSSGSDNRLIAIGLFGAPVTGLIDPALIESAELSPD
jgi:hypothetical protein